ncbi:hypothetical protein PanWU01x14_273800, partial [Parasponia andersonii]
RICRKISFHRSFSIANLSELDENNEERLEDTTIDIKKTPSTLPQPHIVESFKAGYPKALLEAW